jgi:hypothetical protein
MKKIVITFGLISGLVISGLMLISMSLWRESSDFEYGEVLGYLSMVIALSTIFFGVKSYRDNELNGSITFGKGFLIGLLITMIAGVIYVVAWEIYFQTAFSNFSDQYLNHSVEKIKDSGVTAEEANKKISELKESMEMYNNNTIFRMAITFTEIFPVGLIISLISAAILRKKEILPA